MTMKIKIDFTKSAQENADVFYRRSKKLIQKRKGAEEAIRELSLRLKNIDLAAMEERKPAAMSHRAEWYEKFHWAMSSSGLLMIGGRDAQQNELLNSKHFGDSDLFLHASIFGASVTVLKDGAQANRVIREEAAQFAASYSSAWKDMLHSVDVYAMRRDQVSKSTGKGSIGTGSFLLSGERDWYRNTRLALAFFVKDSRLNAVPQLTFDRLEERQRAHALVTQGKDKKSDAAKKIAAALDFYDINTIMQQLPAGTFHINTIK